MSADADVSAAFIARLISLPSAGKCVLTLGTSADDAGSGGLDLIPSHSYAVIGKLNLSSSGCSVSTHADRVPATDVRETGDRRQLVLVNPWRSDPPESTWTSGLRDTLPSAEGERSQHAESCLVAGSLIVRTLQIQKLW